MRAVVVLLVLDACSAAAASPPSPGPLQCVGPGWYLVQFPQNPGPCAWLFVRPDGRVVCLWRGHSWYAGYWRAGPGGGLDTVTAYYGVADGWELQAYGWLVCTGEGEPFPHKDMSFYGTLKRPPPGLLVPSIPPPLWHPPVLEFP